MARCALYKACGSWESMFGRHNIGHTSRTRDKFLLRNGVASGDLSRLIAVKSLSTRPSLISFNPYAEVTIVSRENCLEIFPLYPSENLYP